jgi:RHS repeat-associated protein
LNVYFNPDIIAANDYYPFGMLSRVATSSTGVGYRYGFNGKEDDYGAKGAFASAPSSQDQLDYGARIYDPRIGRFLSVDPLTKQYPHYTPYSYAGDKPIRFIDIDGKEEGKHWYEYDFVDFMNWLQTPSSPLEDNSFVHKLATSANRNLNPLYYAYVLTTGHDPSSNDYAKMGRMDAAFSLTTMAILHKSISIATTPPVQMQIEKQMIDQAISRTEQKATTIHGTTEASTSNTADAGQATLQQRAQEIHDAQATQYEKNMSTTAVGQGTTVSGESVTMVASSKARLSPAQRAVLKPGEIPIKNKILGVKSIVKIHAEQKITLYANKNNITLSAIAPSRPACPSCVIAINESGAQLQGRVKQVNSE